MSALPCYSTDRYPYKSLHPYIRQAYDAFGPERLFWGTDLSRSPIPYRQHVTMFTEELPWLKGKDLELVMGELEVADLPVSAIEQREPETVLPRLQQCHARGELGSLAGRPGRPS